MIFQRRVGLMIFCLLLLGCKLCAQERVVSADTIPFPSAVTAGDTLSHLLQDTLQRSVADSLLITAPDSLLPFLPDPFLDDLPDALHPLQADSLLYPEADSFAQDSLEQQPGMLEAPVIYEANDSIVLTSDNFVYLYGSGDVKYQQIQLQAELISMSMDSTIVYATFAKDTTDTSFGFPLFIDGEEQIEAKMMRYNFKTGRAYAREILTQQGEGYLTAAVTKKFEDNTMNLKDGQYTTCDEHDHPHFYFKITKAKARPGKNIVTGPVYLVVEDVPLYALGLPFAFFPFSTTYSSGIIPPSYSDEMARGFCLRDGGYYLALSDHFDLALKGEIFSKGSWGVSANSNYRKRYRYSGGFDASYIVTKTGDRGLPDYSASKDFKINWRHSQDAKANPFRSFSASVNFSTSKYDRNQVNQMFTRDATNNNKGSSVNVTQRFPNNPLTVSASMTINQRSRDSSLSVSLPDLNISMSRIFPLKRKEIVGKERWYEKISMSYTGSLRNSIETKEDLIFKKSLVKDWRNAMQHSIPVSATYTALGYLNISPSFNYTERWYTNKVKQAYDYAERRVMPVDTTYGFYRLYDYNLSLSASTTLYGFFTPIGIFGKRVERIRHRMEPSISFSYRPDFGATKYGYYHELSYMNSAAEMVTTTYSPFNGQLFGVPSAGRSGSISFSLNNNLEAKVKPRAGNDSTETKKVSLIDNLSLGMSYNMAADSFNWSPLSVNLRLKITRSYTFNIGMVFDTYTYGYDEATNRPIRLNIPRWQGGKGIGRLQSTGSGFSYTLNNEVLKKLLGRGKDPDKKKGKSSDNELFGDDGFDSSGEDDMDTGRGGRLMSQKRDDSGLYDADGYFLTSVPWSFSFNYSLSIGYGLFNPKKMEYDYRLNNSLSFNGTIQPTKKWNLSFNATYDFETKRVSYMTCNISRDLHCFQMTGSVIPIGPMKSYMFTIAVNSSLLKDLKYNQSSNYRDALNWY